MTTPTDILLVEPTRQEADTIRRSLQRQGHGRGLLVADLPGALAHLFPEHPKAGPPRVILLDLWTPHANGCDLLRRIRQHPATEAVPVVVLSSSRNDWEVLRCYQLGANSYMTKPDKPDDLARMAYEAGRFWVSAAHPQT